MICNNNNIIIIIITIIIMTIKITIIMREREIIIYTRMCVRIVFFWNVLAPSKGGNPWKTTITGFHGETRISNREKR
jgi:hypothetical protein